MRRFTFIGRRSLLPLPRDNYSVDTIYMDYLDKELAKFSKEDIKAAMTTTLAVPFSVDSYVDRKLEVAGSSKTFAERMVKETKKKSSSLFNLPIVVGFQLSQDKDSLQRVRSKSCDHSSTHNSFRSIFNRDPTYESLYDLPFKVY